MSERKGPPPDERRNFNESWRYGSRYGSGGNGSSGSNLSGGGNGASNSSNANLDGSASYSNGSNSNSSRRFGGSGDLRSSGGYSKSRNSSLSGYGRYLPYQTSYGGGGNGGYNSKRYNGAYRSNSSSSGMNDNNNTTTGSASQEPPSHHFKSHSSSSVPTSSQSNNSNSNNSTSASQAPFQRYNNRSSSSQEAGIPSSHNSNNSNNINNSSNNSSSLHELSGGIKHNKRDLSSSHGSRLPYANSSFYDRNDSYRSGGGGRYYGSGGYRDRDVNGYSGYRGYQQRKSSSEHLIKKEKEHHQPYHHHHSQSLSQLHSSSAASDHHSKAADNDDYDLIYGSIKPKVLERPRKHLSISRENSYSSTGNDAKDKSRPVKSETEFKKEQEKEIARKSELEPVSDDSLRKLIEQPLEKSVAKVEEKPLDLPSPVIRETSVDILEPEKKEEAEDKPGEKMEANIEVKEREEKDEEQPAKVDLSEPASPIHDDNSIRRTSSLSDSYDPTEAPLSEPVIITAKEESKSIVPSLISSLNDDIDELDVDEEEQELEKLVLSMASLPISLEPSKNATSADPELMEVDDSVEDMNENYLPKDIEGDIFPLNRLEFKLWELKKNSKSHVRTSLPHLITAKSLTKDLQKYPFYHSNILIHEQAIRPKLMADFQKLKKMNDFKRKKLLLEFHDRGELWKKRVKIMEAQLKQLHPELNDNAASADANATGTSGAGVTSSTHDLTVQSPTQESSTSSRRNRNTGIVNSEAEFAEILQRMKEEEENDPVYRAKQAAAVIPEMIIDPIERDAFKFICTNNLVTDLVTWESRLVSDKIDNFTKEEHELFCEAYASYPKRFGKISAAMNYKRTSQDCVLHYYRTKRETNYKLLVAAKNKRNGRKSGAAKNKGKSGTKAKGTTTSTTTPATTSTTAPVSANSAASKEVVSPLSSKKETTPVEEEEEVYTDSGRKKRAALPTFDSSLDAAKAQTKSKQLTSEAPKEASEVAVKEETESGLKKRSSSNAALDSDPKVNVDDERKTKKSRSSQKKKVKEAAPEVADVAQESSESKKAVVDGDGVVAQQVELSKPDAPALQPLPQQQPQEQLQQPQQQEQISEPAQLSQQPQQPVQPPSSNEQYDQVHSPDAIALKTEGTKVSKKDKKLPHITSYWSINDANKFPSILAEYGTQWQLIAKKIQTKTTTMVRNYYSKNANSANNWIAIAREADLRRSREDGETIRQEQQISTKIHEQQQQLQQISQPPQPLQPPQLDNYPYPQPPNQSVRLPSLKDITHGMGDMHSKPANYHSPSPPPVAVPQNFTSSAPSMSQLLSVTAPKKEEEERKYVNVLNDTYQPRPNPPPAISRPQIPPSRTSIMSLLNSEQTDSAPAPKASPLNNILNPTNSSTPSYPSQLYYNSSTSYQIPLTQTHPPLPPSQPQPRQQAQQQQLPPPQTQLPQGTGGLFSLVALAEVATGNQALSNPSNSNNNYNHNYNHDINSQKREN